MNTKILKPRMGLQGQIRVPGDKSISHRSIMFASLAQGVSTIEGLLEGEDVLNTKSAFEQMGVEISRSGNTFTVNSNGFHKLLEPQKEIDCGNSGTTMRLMMGILAASSFKSRLVGDASLMKRPMKRVAEPLKLMGAKIQLLGTDQMTAPIAIVGTKLKSINYELKVASAQVKSAIILAAMHSEGVTELTGLLDSRDHTERMLPEFGFPLEVERDQNQTPTRILIKPGKKLIGSTVRVPSDPSSAAFFAAAAAIVPNSKITIEGVSLNPTRIGFFAVLERMGAKITITHYPSKGEPIGQITVESSVLNGTEIKPHEVPSLIDELPIFAILASQAHGVSKVTGAEELRVKESDRIQSMMVGIQKMGGQMQDLPDGFEIIGPQKLKGAEIETHLDHRIAMSFAIASLIAHGETTINGVDSIQTSFPGFFNILESL
jgi:3-phosphoshikimate 1-carboxyvinyltransferase